MSDNTSNTSIFQITYWSLVEVKFRIKLSGNRILIQILLQVDSKDENADCHISNLGTQNYFISSLLLNPPVFRASSPKPSPACQLFTNNVKHSTN